uniref:TSA: Wollemia nobilis Ref_Wollemi_Transcript_3537_2841 transcribed RNA sequence n=1 Tax=Wollemia nobilis TaxID=56998 RepID=A0A0C9QWQ1_9CONI
MTEVMDIPATEALDRRRDRPSERKEKEKPPEDRKRDRDSRERRDERDERAPRRGGGDYGYKRRHSPSPPPYVARDRRHSPPSRRSPPYKRSRRDEIYDGRRGSPRGGFPDDRRFGYDGVGGYDRGGMGGRGGYPDDRPHSRHLGRFQDWPGVGRSGFSDMGAPQREGLMTYKQFIQELEDDILPAEAERRYEEYRTEYINTQKRAFFEAHKDEDWLKDKYDPSHLEAVIQRRNENAKATAKEFLQDLLNGTLDVGPSAIGSMSSSAKGGQGSDHNSDDDAEVSGKRRRHGRGPAKENDLISSAPKALPVSSDPKRVKKDIEFGQALIRKLDAEKGIEENILGGSEQGGEKSLSDSIGVVIVRSTNAVKGLEGLELLDVVVTYLWRVHGLDYYGMVELKEPPKGLRHIRVESKSNIDEAASAEWEKKLDSTWEARLQGQDPLEIMSAKEKLDAATVEALDPLVRKIRDEKYGWKFGCGAKGCTKLFHAAEFVHKHLKLRHADLVTELTAKARAEIYFNNYMNDTDAPGSAVTPQQSGQRDRMRRRKTGLGIMGDGPSRVRDADHPDRASRRENERIDREEYDRNENSPSQDYQSIPGGQDVGHPDPSMFDPFGPGMHGPPPFGSDMPPPPPVLMPVPGAGPLGPFVPAPPEVTMRMLREQGGPAPFHPNDNNGGPRGRKGRSSGGPSMGGMMDPQVMLPVSPAFRQDPRRIRNYHDLDVPEDEVTVIDYRSL